MNGQRHYENGDSVESSLSEVSSLQKKNSTSKCKISRTYICIAILFIINLLNYMDRYTIAGVLTNVQSYYHINDASGGLLQTIFMAFFMVASPICGFLGDRYIRKWIMVVGITVWVLAVFASTFVPANMFWLFLLFRGIVGIGEASYAVISPSIIADMFIGASRSRMLMLFYFAIPCGSGLGFVVGSLVAAMTGDWRWGVRVTAILGVICLGLIIVFVEEPERGAAERKCSVLGVQSIRTSYTEDLKRLLLNATYMFSTAGYTAIVFVVGTLTWWVPTAIEHNYAYNRGLNSTDELNPDTKAHVNMIFGALTCIGGIAGVGIGSIISQMLRDGSGPFRYMKTMRSDAIICGVGAVISVPTLYFALHEIPRNMTGAWVLVFICITAMCFNWATNVNMLMDVVAPNRRNTANSWQILLSHLFGDASGPYILGMISDAIRGDDDSPRGHFMSLVTSFYLPNVLLVVSAIMFIIAAHTFVRDHHIFRTEMGLLTSDSSTSHLQVVSSSSLSSVGGGIGNTVYSVPLPSPSPFPPKSLDLFYESTKM